MTEFSTAIFELIIRDIPLIDRRDAHFYVPLDVLEAYKDLIAQRMGDMAGPTRQMLKDKTQISYGKYMVIAKEELTDRIEFEGPDIAVTILWRELV